MFVLLLILGIINIYYAIKLKKFRNRAILTFYISSILVVVLRICLFFDPVVDYNTIVYIIILISMPAYLLLITGLSQVMLSVECIFKYNDLEILENDNLREQEKREKIKKSRCRLLALYVTV